MPLIRGTSKKSFSTNVETEMNAGKPQKQAVAVAYSEKRKAEAMKHKPKSSTKGKPGGPDYGDHHS
jgi:hypothetical protein